MSESTRAGDLPLLLVGSGNRHKVGEIAALLSGLPLRVAGADILPAPLAVAETEATFEGNARLKAAAFARAAARLAAPRPRWALSDDSGLCVDALDGAPGVQSARYAAATPDAPADDAANNAKLLAALAGLPPAARGARFVCVIAVCAVPAADAAPPAHLFTTRGEVAGRILDAPRGRGGFGYDPLFLHPASDRTFAELSAAEKNTLSHRARALAAARARLEALLDAESGRIRGPVPGR